MIQKKPDICDTFIESSLLIEKSPFYALHKKFECVGKLRTDDVALNYGSYKKRLDSIGSPWGWDKRPKYQDICATTARISDSRSRLYTLLLDDKEIGYSLTVPRDDLSEIFRVRVGEIENFGVVVEHNGSGYGAPFFKYVCNELFKQGFDAVFLSTRSTNHEKVLPFYEKLGMNIIKQVTKKNDLV